MSYQAHPGFVEPKDLNARIWRYMGLPQLLSVLDKRELFFPSIATLAESDPYEGEPTFGKVMAALNRDDFRRLEFQSRLFKHINFFNCWHMNDGESDAMWKIYIKDSQGVAIQSTVGRLMKCFENTQDTVYMGVVQYVEHDSFEAQSTGLFEASDYMYKRLAFQHEQELRVGTYRADVRKDFFDSNGVIKVTDKKVTVEDILLSPQRKGVYVAVDVPALIERVVVSPQSSTWFSELVISLSKKLGYTFEVVPSKMSGFSILHMLS